MFKYYASTSPRRRRPVIPTVPKKIHRRRSKHSLRRIYANVPCGLSAIMIMLCCVTLCYGIIQ